MNWAKQFLFFIAINSFLISSCSKKKDGIPDVIVPKDSAFINLAHLNKLYVPVIFPDGHEAAGVYIYSAYPDYHPVEATGEGFTCVDDVSRATLVYIRNSQFKSDTALQSKAIQLIRFILEMQADNGYFYNFFETNGTINKTGSTSTATANWWSWRALQTLTEAVPIIKNLDANLGSAIDLAVNKIISNIKTDLVNLPQTTEIISGITLPQWLPAGNASDQAATLILGLIPYCETSSDPIILDYIKKLADGIVLMQAGDADTFPYGLFLSAQNQWHAYGNDQSYALLRAGEFLHDTGYSAKAFIEINNFYSWLITNGYQSEISLTFTNSQFQPLLEKTYEQIAYGFRPMVFATTEAFKMTGQAGYAEMAGQFAAWFLGANEAASNMYDSTTGRCFDAITAAGQINLNAGAESTIEALLTMQRVQKSPAVLAAMYKFKK